MHRRSIGGCRLSVSTTTAKSEPACSEQEVDWLYRSSCTQPQQATPQLGEEEEECLLSKWAHLRPRLPHSPPS